LIEKNAGVSHGFATNSLSVLAGKPSVFGSFCARLSLKPFGFGAAFCLKPGFPAAAGEFSGHGVVDAPSCPAASRPELVSAARRQRTAGSQSRGSYLDGEHGFEF
jgi:hypothetical protein